MTGLLMIEDDPEVRPLLKDFFEEVSLRDREGFSLAALRMQGNRTEMAIQEIERR